jgi:hypothetical protein
MPAYARDRSRFQLRMQGLTLREIDDLLGPPNFVMGKPVVLRRDTYEGPHEPERRPTLRQRNFRRMTMHWLASEELSPLDQLIQREEQQ